MVRGLFESSASRRTYIDSDEFAASLAPIKNSYLLSILTVGKMVCLTYYSASHDALCWSEPGPRGEK